MKLHRTARALFGAGLLAAFAALAVGDTARAEDGEKVYQRALKAAVCLQYDVGGEAEFATGVLIDAKQRLVLTSYMVGARNKHCFGLFPVYEDGELVCKRDVYRKLMQEGKTLRGEFIVLDKKRGLAMLQLDKIPKDAEPLRLAKRSPRAGAVVHSVGNPDASDSLWGYTPGEVRQVYPRRIPFSRREILDATIVETTSPINFGDIGGPLLNDKGQLVGISLGFLGNARNVAAFLDISEIRKTLQEKNIVINGEVVAAVAPKEAGKSELKSGPATENKKDPEVTPKKKDPEVTPKKEEKPSPEETKAQNQLTLAKGLVELGKKESALKRLENLIKDYPKTKAAREAKELIEELKKQN